MCVCVCVCVYVSVCAYLCIVCKHEIVASNDTYNFIAALIKCHYLLDRIYRVYSETHFFTFDFK